MTLGNHGPRMSCSLVSAGSDTDWYIVGGWALDLWYGEPTRAHEDLEFSVPACQAQRYRGVLSDLEFFCEGWQT